MELRCSDGASAVHDGWGDRGTHIEVYGSCQSGRILASRWFAFNTEGDLDRKGYIPDAVRAAVHKPVDDRTYGNANGFCSSSQASPYPKQPSGASEGDRMGHFSTAPMDFFASTPPKNIAPEDN